MRKFTVAITAVLSMGLLAGAPVASGKRGPNIVGAEGTRTPSLVSRIVTAPRKAPPVDVARAYLQANTSTFEIDDTERDLVVVRTERDNDRTLVRFQQRFDGVDVFGAEYVVTLDRSSAGYSVTTANGHYFSRIGLSTIPTYSLTAAEGLALYRMKPLVDVTRTESHGLTILPAGRGRLTYHFTFWGTKLRGGLAKYEMFLDANSGDVAFMYDNLQHDTDGSIESMDSHGIPRQTNYVQTDGGRQEMRDRQRDMFATDGGEITTHRPTAGSYEATGENLISRASCCASFPNPSAVDAHWGAGETYEFYKALGRNSIDDNGMSIVSTVNFEEFPGEPNCNAFWDGNQMVYGDCYADLDETYALTADLDVAGHELTHGVTQYTSNLVYANQPGAMNEAYSDYFGNAIDDNVNNPNLGDEASGYVGEDICVGGTPPPPITTDSGWTCPLRDLNDGHTIDDYVFYLVDYDNGGVHLNSTIYGGALWDFRQSLYGSDGQAGSDRADQYVLDALETMTPLDEFVDGRNVLLATIDAADLPSEAADVGAAQAAFDGKGIVDGWDTGAPTDSTVLVEDVQPIGFFFTGPQVGGDRFVIGDYEDKTQTFGYAKQIYVGNTTPPVDLTRVSEDDPNTTTNELPDISGDQVVWVRVRLNGSNADFDVVGRSLTGGATETLAGGHGSQSYPSIDGNLLAWQKGFKDIYAMKLGGEPRKITGKGQQMRPDVIGKWIVYQQFDRFGGSAIGMYNWRTEKTTVIKGHGPASFGAPGAGPGYVYWFNDAKFMDGQGGIYRAKLGTTDVETVVGQKDGPFFGFLSGELIPSANSAFVTYFDEARSPVGPDAGVPPDQIGRDVYIVPVTGGDPVLITSNRGEQVFPAILPGATDDAMWLDTARGQTDLVRS